VHCNVHSTTHRRLYLDLRETKSPGQIDPPTCHLTDLIGPERRRRSGGQDL
jgi:hypothetical protein